METTEMEEKKIDLKISYIECVSDPLSADIGIVREDDAVWLYDVGYGDAPISGLNGTYDVVLSHFHPDHTGNIGKIRCRNLYLSKETLRHLPKDIDKECNIHIVTEPLTIGDLTIFPIPSSHAKGCLGLEVEGRYAFVGDALYSRSGKNGYFYNAQILREEIVVLKALKSSLLLVSHREGLLANKDDVIRELEAIYARKGQGSSEIPMAW